MPPKKSIKKKSGSSKASGKKSANSSEDSLTFNEVVMTYQLEVKLRLIKEVKHTIEDVQAKNEKQRQRGRFLKQEQNKHIKDVVSQARSKEQELSQELFVPYEDVEQALKEKLLALKREEAETQRIKNMIAKLNDDIKILNVQLKNVQDYKSVGQFTDKTHINVLHKEMKDMEVSLREMTEFFDKSLHAIKHEIIKKNEEDISNQKQIASEEVITNLDKKSEQEFLDNKWLNKEVAIHRRNIVEATGEVELLEKNNLEMMSRLFDQQLADVNETRQFYLACKAEDEKELVTYSQEPAAENSQSDDEGSEYEETKKSNQEELPDDLKWLDNYLPDFGVEDDCQLGSMELRRLCITGTKIKLHSSEGTSEQQAGVYQPWNVEKSHLKPVLKI